MKENKEYSACPDHSRFKVNCTKYSNWESFIGKANTQLNTPGYYKKDEETYFEMMRKRLLQPKGKLLHSKDLGCPLLSEKCCDKPEKYRNVISNNLKFYSCRNCGADLGDIN